MAEVICPPEELIVIEKDQLLEKVMEMKHARLRLAQACAAYIDGKYELSYSFSNDKTYEYKTLRVIMGLTDSVPSVTEIYPYATFYENEMQELYGCQIRMINVDYHDRLYRIKEKAPFLPADAKKILAEALEKKAAEESSREETEEKSGTEGASGGTEKNGVTAASAGKAVHQNVSPAAAGDAVKKSVDNIANEKAGRIQTAGKGADT